MSQHKKHNPGNPGSYISARVCAQRVDMLKSEINSLSTEVSTIKRTLVGKDLRGGIVKDIQDIKSKLAIAKILWPIVAAVVTAGLMKILGV